MTDTRAQFEVHFAIPIWATLRNTKDEYRDELTQLRWEGWQAALRFAYDVTAINIVHPERHPAEPESCVLCDGTGMLGVNNLDCGQCNGTGRITDDA
jgi:hypothetical protein